MKAKNIKVAAAQYAEDYKVRIMFSDNTWKMVDFKPFLYAYDRGYYNKYRKPDTFKRFKIEEGNIVWGRNWDLLFPVHELYAGKIKVHPKPVTDKAFREYLNG